MSTRESLQAKLTSYQQRRKHKLYLRATRKQIERELGHKLTGRQWVRRRRALAQEAKQV